MWVFTPETVKPFISLINTYQNFIFNLLKFFFLKLTPQDMGSFL